MTNNKTRNNDTEVFQKQKLVMNIKNIPEVIELVDRFNLYVVRSKKHKTKSDAIAFLLKKALDMVDAEARKDMERRAPERARIEAEKTKEDRILQEAKIRSTKHNKKDKNIASVE